MNKGWLTGLMLAVVAGGTMLMPNPAEAYWVRTPYGPVWRAPFVGVPGPVVVGAPYPGYPHRHWWPAHYNRFGYFVPGHWD